MSRRRLHLLVTLLLPFMALRAFLPVGYMVAAPAAGAGQWGLVMCSEGLFPVTDHAAGAAASGHQQPGDADHSDHCPFASAAAPVIPVAATWSVLVASFTLHFISAARDQLPPATGPPRQSPARAPPALHA
ncbi:MAG: DUF2946 family protein [Steroidobacteraceae bacterium]